MSKKVEKLVKTVFVYDEDGYFEDTHIAQVNPKRPGSYLMPPRCTLVKPALKPKFFYKIKTVGDENSGWDEIPFPQSAADFVGVEIPHKSRTLHNHMLRSLLTEYVKDDPEHFREVAVNDKNGDKIATTVEAIPEPTEAEKTAQKEAAARSTRDYYLSHHIRGTRSGSRVSTGAPRYSAGTIFSGKHCLAGASCSCQSGS